MTHRLAPTTSRRTGPGPAAALAVFLLGGLAGPAFASVRSPADLLGVPVVEAVLVETLARPGEVAPPSPVPALLSVLAGWDCGDAAVVLVTEEAATEPLHHRLAEALLAEGAAVLELDIHAARGLSPDSAAVADPPPTARDVLPELFGALRTLRGHAGAGPVVVAVGTGVGGAAALLAATEGAKGDQGMPPGEPGFAAAVALDAGGPAAFAAGAPPPAAEHWELRAPLLCAALAEIAADTDPAMHPRRFRADCVAALLGGGGHLARPRTPEPPPPPSPVAHAR